MADATRTQTTTSDAPNGRINEPDIGRAEHVPWRIGTDGYGRVLREGRGGEVNRRRRLRLRFSSSDRSTRRQEDGILRLTLVRSSLLGDEQTVAAYRLSEY